MTNQANRSSDLASEHAIKQELLDCLTKMGVAKDQLEDGDLVVTTPIDGSEIARIACTPADAMDTVVAQSVAAFHSWRTTPAPKRGELVRLLGEKLRTHKTALGKVVSIECGKILQEGLGEVQEMIDICDFAVGLSRQLYGLTIASERESHKMLETWQPIGPVGIISAFNFPVAVWSWNAALALVCGNPIIWKPSEKTPLTALACQAILKEAIRDFGEAPDHLSQVVIGDASIGKHLASDPGIPVVSATGSCAMGRAVAPIVAGRFGRSILELGGNNAVIVTPTADLEMALRAIVFGAVGTAGQRCTTTRRLFVHEQVFDELNDSLKRAFNRVTIGNPLEEGTLVGPLIDQVAFDNMQSALALAKEQGAILSGGERQELYSGAAFYVKPALVTMPDSTPNVTEETFAPILYMFKYSEIEDAIRRNNAVPQGLSSAIFTNDVREAELFTSSTGSDCGIANVNIGTSGAEIGGAFGGEKDTGGGRESGSDAWKGYMRRTTSTVNYGSALPLAQGIKFDI